MIFKDLVIDVHIVVNGKAIEDDEEVEEEKAEE